MNASEKIEELLLAGWKPYNLGNLYPRRWFFYRPNRYDFFTDYLTVFRNGRVLTGIIQKGQKRRKV